MAMNDHLNAGPTRSDMLARAAHADARRLTPRFSESLHLRVMGRVASAERATLPIARTARWPAWGAPAAAAAAVIGVFVLRPGLSPHPNGRAITVPARHVTMQPDVVSVASVQLTFAKLSRREAALETDLGSRQWEQFGHDARVAARLVLDPIPAPPVRQARLHDH